MFHPRAPPSVKVAAARHDTAEPVCSRVAMRNTAPCVSGGEQASIAAELIVDKAVRAAIEQNERAELATLLERGASSDGGSYLAADLGRSECLATLLPYTKYDTTSSTVDKPAKYGTTALHVASSKGHTECVQLLIDAGALIDVQCGPDLETALHVCCARGKPDIAEQLIAAGANLAKADAIGRHATQRIEP